MSQSDLQQQQQQPRGQPLLQRSSLSDYNTLPFKRLPAARRERQCKPCSTSSMSGGGGAAPVQGTVMRWRRTSGRRTGLSSVRHRSRWLAPAEGATASSSNPAAVVTWSHQTESEGSTGAGAGASACACRRSCLSHSCVAELPPARVAVDAGFSCGPIVSSGSCVASIKSVRRCSLATW